MGRSLIVILFEALGFSSTLLNSFGLLDSFEVPWNLLDSRGILLDSLGFSWSLFDSLGFLDHLRSS